MQVYAKAHLSNKPKLVQYTSEDPHGDDNPRWNHSFHFILKSTKTSDNFLDVVLYDMRHPGEEAPVVGHVQIPLETFQDENKEPTPPRKFSQRIPEGGIIHFSYKLGKYESRSKAVGKKIAQVAVGVAAHGAIAAGIGELVG